MMIVHVVCVVIEYSANSKTREKNDCPYHSDSLLDKWYNQKLFTIKQFLNFESQVGETSIFSVLNFPAIVIGCKWYIFDVKTLYPHHLPCNQILSWAQCLPRPQQHAALIEYISTNLRRICIHLKRLFFLSERSYHPECIIRDIRSFPLGNNQELFF